MNWISVKDRLPVTVRSRNGGNTSELCLVCIGNDDYDLAYYEVVNDNTFKWEGWVTRFLIDSKDVTRWMYIPDIFENTTKDEIILWAIERNLIHKENAPRQILKLTEEVGELSGAFIKDKKEEIIDAIGDIQVVLIILCEQLGIDYEDALYQAYNTIKDRKGKTVNGNFIKE